MPEAPDQPDRAPPYPSEHENLKPGDPPRPRSEPSGSEGSGDTSKTLTDPATGAPTGGKPDTAL